MLSVDTISCRYRAISALRDVSITVGDGEFVSLVGANGAGKTTLLRAISGLTPPFQGQIHFDGKRLDGATPAEIVRSGIAQSPEERKIWPQLTVDDHIRLGAFSRQDMADVRRDIDRIHAIFPRLAERRRQLVGTLSGGEQQMVAIGRALMSRPRLLLLDEPSLGLAPMMVAQVIDTVCAINREGTAILMVEQNATVALRHANRAYVLENGKVVKEGSGADLLHDPDVKRAYLGADLAKGGATNAQPT
jgi:branched-chain amino acid transport system ATP-binding protein